MIHCYQFLSFVVSFAIICQDAASDCDHYQQYPTDMCKQGTSSSFEYSCDGSETMMKYSYDTTNCTGNVSSAVTYDLTDDEKGDCSSGETCDYYKMVCNNGLSWIAAINECIFVYSFEVIYQCYDTILLGIDFSESGCNGTVDLLTLDMQDFYSPYYDGCYDVCFAAFFLFLILIICLLHE